MMAPLRALPKKDAVYSASPLVEPLTEARLPSSPMPSSSDSGEK